MTISVTQLNNYIKGIFDLDGLMQFVSVCGEITNVKQNGTGFYFTIKDDSSAVNCFCYGNTGVPVTGAMAVIEGKVNFWPKSGSISLFVRKLVISTNTGEAYLKFLELKDKLSKEGLFDADRKIVVPKCCEKIGVVTSETGAVIHDIEKVSFRRQPFTKIILYPVKVQGFGAEQEICNGIKFFANCKNPEFDVDVIIVGRGGGSNEDLSVFNSESIVREIADCKKPVVSAVGHNVDYTLCDFVADARAATPSEAAELVTIDSALKTKNILDMLNGSFNRLQLGLKKSFDSVKIDLRRVYRETERKVDDNIEHVNNILIDKNNLLKNKIENFQNKIDNDITKLSSNNPANILKKGYSYLKKDKENVCSVENVAVGDNLEVVLLDGKLGVTVNDIKK